MKEFDGQQMFGPFPSGQKVSRTYSDLPPHYTYSYRVDIFFWQNWDGIQFKIGFDDSTPTTFIVSNLSITAQNKFSGWNSCCDYYDSPKGGWIDECILYRAQFSPPPTDGHSGQILDVFFEDIGGAGTTWRYYLIKNIQLTVERCHFTCLRCTGSLETDCTACPDNDPQADGKCKCRTGYAYNNDCIQQCPDDLFADNNLMQCVQSKCEQNCQLCDDVNKICKKCSNGMYLYQGFCLKTCPPNSQPTILFECKHDLLDYKNAFYLSLGLFEDNFSDLHAKKIGFTQVFNQPASYSECLQKRYYGGYLNFAGTSSISLQVNNIPPHYKIQSSPQLLPATSSNYNLKCGLGGYWTYYNTYSKSFDDKSTSVQLQIVGKNSNKQQDSFGMREFYIIIEKCQVNCLDCDSTGCKKCVENFYLLGKDCVETCPDSYFPQPKEAIPNCEKCHSTCKTCSLGKDEDKCDSCAKPKYLKQGKCVDSCTPNFYANEEDRICIQCHPTCKNCSSSDENSCTQCSSPLYLNKAYGTCVQNIACPQNFYPDDSTWECKKCDASCLTCDNGTNKDCTSCIYFLYKGTCRTDCPPGYYENKEKKKCDQCSSQCFKCVDLPNFCTECTGSLFLHENKCETNCPVGYFPLNNLCNSCNLKCLTCEGGNDTDCLSCGKGKYLYLKKCEESCSEGYWKNEENNTCSICSSNCKTCSTGSYEGCITCKPDFLLTPFNTCEKGCPMNYFPQPVTGLCIQCHTTCATCTSQKEDNCQKCDLGRYFFKGRCLINCEEGYYANGITQTCEQCNNACQTCIGSRDDQCIGCPIGTYFYNNKCFKTSCPNGTYQISQQSQKCSDCNLSCLKCNGPLDRECTACISSKYLDGNACISDCFEGFYKNKSNNKCEPCHSSCKSCSGPTQVECESCPQGSYLNRNEHSCVKKCPDSQYAQELPQRTCMICNPSCLLCDGPTEKNCVQCSSIRYFYNKQCFVNCPTYTYQDTNKRQCISCHPSCFRCTNGEQNQCTQCGDGKYFYEGTCLEKCPSGYFPNKVLNKCYKCNEQCKECTNINSNNCTECKAGNYLLFSNCVKECPSRFSTNKNKNKCIECKSSCLTCEENFENNCVTCAKGWYLLDKDCVDMCPKFAYYTDYAQRKCFQCVQGCERCSEKTKDDCTKWAQSIFTFKIFWIYFSFSLFFLITLFLGFYLDSKPPFVQLGQYKNPLQTVNQIYVQKIAQQPPTSNQQFIENDSPQKNTPQLMIEEIEEVESEEVQSEQQQPEKKKDRNLPTKKRTKMLNLQTKTFGNLPKLEGDIRQKSDAEVLDLVFPKTQVFTNQQNNKKEEDKQSIVSLQHVQKKSSSFNSAQSKDISGNDSTKVAKKKVITKEIPQIERAINIKSVNKANKIQPNERGFMRTFVEFFEVSSLVVRSEKTINRPFRSLLFYVKILFLIYLASPLLELYFLVYIPILIAWKMFTNLIYFLVDKISSFYEKWNYLLFAAGSLYIAYFHNYQFFPYLFDELYPKTDDNWCIYFAIIFASDLVVVQGIFLIIQYLITRYITFSEQYSFFQRLLSIFCFEKKISHFIQA